MRLKCKVNIQVGGRPLFFLLYEYHHEHRHYSLAASRIDYSGPISANLLICDYQPSFKWPLLELLLNPLAPEFSLKF